MKNSPPPTPFKIPCARSSCQYFVHRLVMKIPMTCRLTPMRRVGRKSPASSRRPEKAPMKKVRKFWIVPIHEMLDGLASRCNV